MSRPPRDQGFSTMEALVAFAIAIIVLAGGYRLLGNSLAQQFSSDAIYGASAFARSQLEEHLYSGGTPKEHASGIYAAHWRWEITSIPTPDQPATRYDPLIQLRRYTIRVSRGDAELASLHADTAVRIK